MMPKLTEQHLMEAVRRSMRATSSTQEGAFRLADMARITGIGISKAQRLVREGLDNGTIRRESVMFESISGVVKRVPAYVFVEKPVGKTKGK